ncbi:hypothetical protein [Sinorhizobium medicae]|uniref:hypothetical protein n=1 Tax=Sinorhizobium medicae TaxID=110321 RepID=UPI001FB35E97|nr:hypothetical protein [Sinorhizobium medicae]
MAVIGEFTINGNNSIIGNVRTLTVSMRVRLDLEQQVGVRQKMLRQFGRDGERLFPRVRNRIAVFTYDQTYSTADIGDAVSFILSKKMLFSSRVGSLGIVNYQDGLKTFAIDEPA